MTDAKRYGIRVDPNFLEDMKLIRDKGYVTPEDWGLFRAQMRKEQDILDRDWETKARKTEYPPLSTYGYLKRYMHSIPLSEKAKRNWEDRKSDFRIVFKVDEEKKELYYLAIGKRIKGLPKDPDDIWSLIKGRKLPEEESD